MAANRRREARPAREPAEFELVGPAQPPKQPRALSTRGKARKRALDILFEAELRGLSPVDVLTERAQDDVTPPVRQYTHDLVHGVVDHLNDIDARVRGALAAGWTIPRMPRIDRAAVRVAVFEIDHTDLPPKVAIAEAVGLVDDLSTDDSPAFVNGLLAKIADSVIP